MVSSHLPPPAGQHHSCPCLSKTVCSHTSGVFTDNWSSWNVRFADATCLLCRISISRKHKQVIKLSAALLLHWFTEIILDMISCIIATELSPIVNYVLVVLGGQLNRDTIQMLLLHWGQTEPMQHSGLFCLLCKFLSLFCHYHYVIIESSGHDPC